MVDLKFDLVYLLEPNDLQRALALAPFALADCARLSIADLVAFADRAIARGDTGLIACIHHGIQGRRDGRVQLTAAVGRLETALMEALGYIERVPDRAVAA